MDRGCSCLIAPPCNYCVQTSECAICGEIEHVDEGELFEGGKGLDVEFMCSKCVAKTEDCD